MKKCVPCLLAQNTKLERTATPSHSSAGKGGSSLSWWNRKPFSGCPFCHICFRWGPASRLLLLWAEQEAFFHCDELDIIAGCPRREWDFTSTPSREPLTGWEWVTRRQVLIQLLISSGSHIWKICVVQKEKLWGGLWAASMFCFHQNWVRERWHWCISRAKSQEWSHRGKSELLCAGDIRCGTGLDSHHQPLEPPVD